MLALAPTPQTHLPRSPAQSNSGLTSSAALPVPLLLSCAYFLHSAILRGTFPVYKRMSKPKVPSLNPCPHLGLGTLASGPGQVTVSRLAQIPGHPILCLFKLPPGTIPSWLRLTTTTV
jgi:hypothetical protein